MYHTDMVSKQLYLYKLNRIETSEEQNSIDNNNKTATTITKFSQIGLLI